MSNTEQSTLAQIRMRSDRINAETSEDTWLNIRPSFQRDFEAWDDMMKTRLIETIILNRAMNPIWTVANEEDKSEEVLDGMHRLMTSLSYLNNDFYLNKKYFTQLGEEYDKKYFKNLNFDEKNNIKKYKFNINNLDTSFRKNPNKLKDMYEILNRSSKPLNDYEFNKVLYRSFYDLLIKKKMDFKKNKYCKNIKDSRGNMETELIDLLVLSENLPESWQSINDMRDKWLKNNLGITSESVYEYINKEESNINTKLDLILKYINLLDENNLFSNDKREFNNRFLPIKFIIVRCIYKINDISLFNRHLNNLIKLFTEEILSVDIQDKLNCKSRNAVFQKKIINTIDEIIDKEIDISNPNNKRIFPKKMIKEKLQNQNYICPLCNKNINDNYEGDHITSWTSGGQTTMCNLQVVHKRCHQLKNS
jgi:hypothetical protein